MDLRRRLLTLDPEPQPEEIEAFLSRGISSLKEYVCEVVQDALKSNEMEIPEELLAEKEKHGQIASCHF